MPQSLILEATRGPLQGRTYAVPEGGSLLVGRLPECDVSLQEDLTVSRQHCRVEYRPPLVQLVHLSQTGPTLVNGTAVSRWDLRTGDVIEVGTGSAFCVRLQASDNARAAGAQPPLDRSKAPVKFSSVAASCGWSLIRFPDAFPGISWLLEILGRASPVRAIIDLSRTGQNLDDLGEGAQPLFPWITRDLWARFSPMFISQATCPAIRELVTAGVGKDGLVSFGSTLDDAALLAHWRTASGVVDDQPGKALSVYHWPSLLNLILTCQGPAQTKKLLGSLTWIVAEDPEAPGGCSLFCEPSIVQQLTKAGLSPLDMTATVTSPNQS